MLIKKSEVHEALSKMELHLFGKDFKDNPHTPPVLRMMSIFTEGYYRNYYPEESVLLRESYKLLQTKGYYYTEE